MTEPVVLFRASWREEDELKICRENLATVTSRCQVQPGETVIGRYSVLPFYRELERDITCRRASLINTYEQHRYVADLQNWYDDLKDYTPKTWFRIEDIPYFSRCDEGDGCGFVLKGETNSKKHLWNTHMYAKNRPEAIDVMCRLHDDDFLQDQRLYAREYVPLKRLHEGLNGLPISEEYRFFVLNSQILTGAFYWSNYRDHLKAKGFNLDANNVPSDFLDRIIEIVAPNIPFFVLDVARTANDEWIVIELNDGQMSGLSDNDPSILYSGIARTLS